VEVDAMGKWMLILMVTMLFAGAGVNEARAADSPTITISPNSGSCDQPVTISVAGFGDDWVNVMVGPVGAEPQVPQYALLYAQLPSNGSFSFTPFVRSEQALCDEFARPAMRIVATLSENVQAGAIVPVAAETTFTKTRETARTSGPTITLDPTSGRCDRPIAVHGTGFRAGAKIQLGVAPLVTLPGNGGGGFALEAQPTVDAAGGFVQQLDEPGVEMTCNQTARMSVTATEARGQAGFGKDQLAMAVFHGTKSASQATPANTASTEPPSSSTPASRGANLVPSGIPPEANSDDANQAAEVVVTVLGALAAAAATLFVARQT
jgi:hypothetical protein